MAHIVMTALAKMPTSCRGKYMKVAVVELEDGFNGTPKMISTRAHGVKRIVKEYEPANVGKTDQCAYARTLKTAEALAADLNNQA